MVLGLLLMLPIAFAATLKADIELSTNDLVTEKIALDFYSENSFDVFTFTTLSEPISIVYDGDYTITRDEDEYTIEFIKDILPGENEISFILLFDDLVVRQGKTRVFHTGFPASIADDAAISVTLPEGFIMTDAAPKKTHVPMEINTDGRQITIHWSFAESDIPLIVLFYKGPSGLGIYLMIGILMILLIVVIVYLVLRKRTHRIITDTLSGDEMKIVGKIREGIDIQKKIAQELGFSKSKISKVIRKLEEKGLLEKETHFKTNRLKLKKIK